MAELSTSINNLQVTSEPQYITVNRELMGTKNKVCKNYHCIMK